MIELEYYYTTSKKWFLDFAEAFSKASGQKVIVQDSSLILPEDIATGRFEFHQLGEGISVLIIDCTFLKEVRMHRKAVSASDQYKILFNVSEKPFVVSNENGKMVNLSGSFAEAVLFSSHSKGLSLCPPVGDPMRAVVLVFDRSWGIRHFFKHPMLMMVNRVQQFLNYEPMQFLSHLDAISFRLIEEMLTANSHPSTIKQYLKGCVYQLSALFFNNIIKEQTADERIISAEATILIQLKEKIENNLKAPMPSVEEAADLCLMSRTKFMTMFKTLYNKSYLSYFSEIRLEKAKQLLVQNIDINTVAAETGYSNVAYFSKVFKSHFGVSPLEFRQ